MVILDDEDARKRRNQLRDEDRTVVFTNGCFDLLHKGHLHLLREAKNQGDYLIVGLNTDDSIRRIKGGSRPVKNEENRSAVLDALEMVDAVVLFEEDTPKRLIELLSPDVLVKGSDYEPDEVVGAEHVQAEGGRVYLVDLLPGQSTTSIVETIRQSGEARES